MNQFFKGACVMNDDQYKSEDMVEVYLAAQTDIVGWGAGGCGHGSYGLTDEV